ncbi:MAG: class IIb bacteriocin, lactobin A/cerein 7B family [Tannerella sp.]|uniref:class IIb bacteriocin, lactobin A/cerein 7B family n=1 Tax=Tannerella sp. TaxID=2382127 RepID=UPI003FA2E05B
MKNSELTTYGVVELNAQEMEEVNGGSLLIAWGAQLFFQEKAARMLANCIIGAYEAGYDAGRNAR